MRHALRSTTRPIQLVDLLPNWVWLNIALNAVCYAALFRAAGWL